MTINDLSGPYSIMILLMAGVVVGIMVTMFSARLVPPLLNSLMSYFKRNYTEQENLYLERVSNTHTQLTLSDEIGQATPKVSIDNLFVPPRLRFPDGHEEKFSLSSLLRPENRQLIVLGEPGSGKSTLLRHITIEMCRLSLNTEASGERILPFLVSLRQYTKTIDFSLSELLEHNSAPYVSLPAQHFSSILQSGKAMVLLDGLDEIGERELVNRVLDTVQKWSKLYIECQFVLTSRSATIGPDRIPKGFTVSRLMAFNDVEIEQFVSSWTYRVFNPERYALKDTRQTTYQPRVEELRSVLLHNRHIAELAGNPLLLTLIAATHFFKGAIPNNRALLYQDAIAILLQRLTKISPTYKVHFVLETIAFSLQAAGLNAATRDFILEAIETARRIFGIEMGAPDLYLALVEESGILVEDAPEQFSFLHRTFQEYLAARFAIDAERENILVEQFCTDLYWRGVILFYAELKHDATEIIDSVYRSDLPTLEKYLLLCQILQVSKASNHTLRHQIISDATGLLTNTDYDTEKKKELQEALNLIARSSHHLLA